MRYASRFSRALLITVCSAVFFKNPVRAQNNLSYAEAHRLRTDRPVIALVLSGGGAKGLAEIPLLEEIERLGIPVDMVLGTSMGSMIGALYASGYTPAQIREIFLSTDIMTALNIGPVALQKLPPEPFSLGMDNYGQIEFSKDGIGAAPALLGDQHILNLLARNFSRIPADMDFDYLPRRFRACATNISNFEEVVFKSGSIVKAVRGSMSLPAVWTPAIVDKSTYVMDGGMVDNLPIKLARDMGADIIIAMDVASHLESDPSKIDSISAVAINLFNLSISANAVMQHELATLLLLPDLRDFSTLDFLHVKEIIEVGERCIRENQAAFEELAEKLESVGVRLSPQDPGRTGKYKSLPVLEVERVVVEDVSLREKVPLPRESDFQFLVGKILDDKTQDALISKLDEYQKAFSLASLTYEVRRGTKAGTCTLAVLANHYAQNESRLFVGGKPFLSFYGGPSSVAVGADLDLSGGVYLIKPFPMYSCISTGEVSSLNLTLRPQISRKNEYVMNFNGSVTFKSGSLEPKDSVFFADRTVDGDYGIDVLGGIQLHYASLFSFSTGLAYSWNYLHSKKGSYNLFSAGGKGVWNSMDDIVALRGLRAEFLYEFALEPSLDYFLYNGRVSVAQRFEVIKNVAALGYEFQAALMHFPWQLNCGYAEYGGLYGMSGFPYGTKRRNFALTGATYTHRLVNIAGMPLFIMAKINGGIQSPYNPYTATEGPGAGVLSAEDGFRYDLGAGAYLALKTPAGSLILGGSANLHGDFCFIITFM